MKFTYRDCNVTITKDKGMDGTPGVVFEIEVPGGEIIDGFWDRLNLLQGTVDAKITIDDYYEAMEELGEEQPNESI